MTLAVNRHAILLARMEAELNSPRSVQEVHHFRPARPEPSMGILTNLCIEQMIRAHRGVILSHRNGAPVRIQQPVIIRELRQAGPHNPAIYAFTVKAGIGYLSFAGVIA